MLSNEHMDPYRFYIEFTRHNPVLCTACLTEKGSIEVNGKVVGIGYIPKKEHMKNLIKIFEEHIWKSDEEYFEHQDDEEYIRRLRRNHSKRGAKLLLKYIYLDEEDAADKIDFEKLATIELAARLPHSSKHTWRILQHSDTASLVFFQPPSISYELKGRISIHLDDDYHRLVNLVHDAYHYTPPENRGFRPVYIFHVEEVYDNSPTKKGFGRRIA